MQNTSSELTQQKLMALLVYCQETGTFRWKVSTSNRVKVGDVAGTINTTTGYLVIGISGEKHLAHRLAWLYVYGVWPSAEIDHINRDRADNRIENLREASHIENMRNLSKPRNNTSGHVGVVWCKRLQKWRAQIEHENKRIHLGYYIEQEDAIAARIAGEVEYWGAARTI